MLSLSVLREMKEGISVVRNIKFGDCVFLLCYMFVVICRPLLECLEMYGFC